MDNNNNKSPIDENTGVIYEKLRVVERDIKEIKRDNSSYQTRIEDRINKQEERLNSLEKTYYQLDTMFTDFLNTQKKVEQNIEKIADKVDHDDNWRSLIIDLLKVSIIIITFAATGNWLIKF